MKKFLLALVTTFYASVGFATTWNITDAGFTFSPDSLTIRQGDTVIFTLQSPHNAQEISQTDWIANNATPIIGFNTPVGSTDTITNLTQGTHYYICAAHAGAGMKGRIVVLPPAPVVQFVVTSSSASEGLGTWNVAVAITNPDPLNATAVDINIAPGATATAGGVDYSFAPFQVVFPANTPVTQNVTIALTNDQLVEGNESFTFKLAFPTNSATIGINSQHTVTILDNDTLKLNIYPTLQSQYENIGTVNVPVALTSLSPNPTSVTVHLQTSNSTATQGSDFVFNDTTITWAANTQGIILVPVVVIEDAIFENDETVRINLVNPTNGAALVSDTFLLVIQNNDAAAPATIRFTTPGTIVAESARRIPVIAEVNNPSNTSITFILARDDAASTATIAADYTYQNISFTNGIGISYDTVFFDLIDEQLIEDTETITFHFIPVSGATAIGADSVFIATVLDNDTLSISFNGAGFSYVEDTGMVQVKIITSSPVPDTIAAIISLAAGNAILNVDYRYTQDTIYFLPNTIDTQSVWITIINDALIEPNEQINFNLTPYNTYARLGISAYTLTIIDNDSPATGIEEEHNIAGIKLYPNPVIGSLTVEAETDLSFIQITDLAGQVIANYGKLSSGKNRIDVAALMAGMYFITIYNQNNSVTKRFIKQD